ncbi:putative zinc iron transporter protein [Rosellinia necatrix]|uniref:Putative zinc iron transporter protein n=1 Tax=Rosellinia necatrix TaxID=77044 RepID=A0A1W2TAK6_ROSNE|nr:putative zinc iron transporter protein [Rosellinia necatrix]
MARTQALTAPIGLFLATYLFYGAATLDIPHWQNSPAPTITPAPVIVPRAAESFTAVTGCHAHGDDAYCLVGTDEYQVIIPATATGEVAPSYTGCHSHGTETFCLGDDGIEVEVLVDGAEGDHDHEGEEHEEGEEAEESSGENCHFHAGVEHCTGDASTSGEVQCSRRDRDYDIPLRIGLVFVMLATSFIGVALPIFLKPLLPGRFQAIFTLLKQFGTGVIIATALIHLFTHASLMFGNECLGELQYEAVTAAIVLAGLFIAFLVEYTTHRIARKYRATSPHPDDVVSVAVLEAGIIFHSLLVGLTLVVAGDSVFLTLFVVIVFHQAFEGIALGTRIATAGRLVADREAGAGRDPPSRDSKDAGAWRPLSLPKKLLMAAAFALVTPVGMAIGIGVLGQFNGNNPSTVVAIGTLDALSAGILLWVGVVEMWATDWMFGGELENASAGTTALAGFGLVAGFVLMGLLGKWA